MDPSILVLTPTLGTRSSLHRTILSVRSFGQGRVLHVLIGPSNLYSRFSTKYPWLRYVVDKSASGVFEALNQGLQMYSQLPYFAYINDDDYWLEGFAKLIDFALTKKDSDFVYARTYFKDNSTHRLRRGAYFPYYQFFPTLLEYGIPIFTQQCLIVRREVLQLLGDKFDVSHPLTADSLLWGKMIYHGAKGASLNLFTSVYSLADGRLSQDPTLINIDSLQQNPIQLSRPNLLPSLLILIFYRIYNLPTYAFRIFSFFSISRSLISWCSLGLF